MLQLQPSLSLRPALPRPAESGGRAATHARSLTRRRAGLGPKGPSSFRHRLCRLPRPARRSRETGSGLPAAERAFPGEGSSRGLQRPHPQCSPPRTARRLPGCPLPSPWKGGRGKTRKTPAGPGRRGGGRRRTPRSPAEGRAHVGPQARATPPPAWLGSARPPRPGAAAPARPSRVRHSPPEQTRALAAAEQRSPRRARPPAQLPGKAAIGRGRDRGPGPDSAGAPGGRSRQAASAQQPLFVRPARGRGGRPPVRPPSALPAWAGRPRSSPGRARFRPGRRRAGAAVRRSPPPGPAPRAPRPPRSQHAGAAERPHCRPPARRRLMSSVGGQWARAPEPAWQQLTAGAGLREGGGGVPGRRHRSPSPMAGRPARLGPAALRPAALRVRRLPRPGPAAPPLPKTATVCGVLPGGLRPGPGGVAEHGPAARAKCGVRCGSLQPPRAQAVALAFRGFSGASSFGGSFLWISAKAKPKVERDHKELTNLTCI